MRKRKNLIKIIISVMVFLAVSAILVTLSLKIDNLETTKTVSSSAYKIGFLDDETGKEPEDQEKIGLFMKDYVLVDGMTCELSEDAKITYSINFYDEDYKFISVLDCETDFNGENVPENAKYAKIEIQPTSDKDGKVSLFEKSDYADMLIVTVSK